MEKQFNEDTKISHALAFAIVAHEKINQKRDDGITPYYVHLLRVMERLVKVGGVTNEEIIMAAALHDVVEDCDVSYEEIRDLFGDTVTLYVKELTIAPGESKENDEYYEKLHNASKEGKTIKLADKWDNIWELRREKYRSYGRFSPEKYAKTAGAVLRACGDANIALADKLEKELKGLKEDIR